MAGILLRDDFDGGAVRALAKTAKDGPQVRRLLALAAIHEGATRGAAARIGFPARLDAVAQQKAIPRDRIEVWFADPAALQHAGDEPASGRDLRQGCARAACPAVARSGRLALVASPGRARKRHTPAAAPPSALNSIRSRMSGSSCATTVTIRRRPWSGCFLL